MRTEQQVDLVDLWCEEHDAWGEGYQCIAGIDEAGRGALAGPVVAACVVLPHEWMPLGCNDSKQLTHDQRGRLFAPIMRRARGVGIGIVSSEVIDDINILRASHEAMRLAFADLPQGLFPDIVFIDGLPVRPFPQLQVALVRGDGRSASIAAASIVAKVTRDRIMVNLDKEFPQYGFAGHKGYGAPVHLRALKEFGPCSVHRRSYRPVAECRLEVPAEGALTALAAHSKPRKARGRG